MIVYWPICDIRYEWSKQDFLRELESDCPLLSLIGLNWRRIAALIAWNKTLSPDHRLQLSKALTMLSHYDARMLKGEVVTEDVLWWKNEKYIQTTRYMDKLPPLVTSNRQLQTFRPIDPDKCLDSIVSSLSPRVLGKPNRQRSAVRCARKISDWKLVTQFTYERRARRLDCTFQFIRKDDKSKYPIPEDGRGLFPRNLYRFYGIYNQTVVTANSQADCETMPKVMLKLAEHFVTQADPLFAGLGISD